PALGWAPPQRTSSYLATLPLRQSGLTSSPRSWVPQRIGIRHSCRSLLDGLCEDLDTAGQASQRAAEWNRGVVTRQANRWRRILSRGVRFGTVGISGLLVNQSALWSLVALGDINYLVAAIVATQCSTAWNFAL